MADIEKRHPHKHFRFLAEQLCLDFANTVGDHATDHPDEYLDDYGDLVLWGQQAGILSADEADLLYRTAREDKSGGAIVFDLALALRETIFRIFSPIAAGVTPKDGDLNALNIVLDAMPVQLRVTRTGETFACEWRVDKEGLDGLLFPIAWSAARLLASDDLQWVKQCANEDCGWLFLDSTKNHSRRWCDMADCGSRAKAKRYYRRQHPKSE